MWKILRTKRFYVLASATRKGGHLNKMKVGDSVICTTTGVQGVIVKIYTPTASEKQIMVRTIGGRFYHAPYRMWVKLE